MKIAVIGYSGAGKSTLAKALGEFYHCPVLYLDRVQFEPGWKERNSEEAKEMVRTFMAQNESWVIDGNYPKFYQTERLENADCIVFLSFNRLICFWQAYRRSRQYAGRSRESITPGCDEKFDFEFIKWILHDGRNKSRKTYYQELIKRFPDKMQVLKSRKEVKRFLTDITEYRV